MPPLAKPVTVMLIGASGYIGGSVLERLCSHQKNVGIHISALVRNPADLKAVSGTYPQVQTLLGDLSNEALLFDAASSSDVVIYAARNTQEGVEPLLKGLGALPTNGLGSSRQSSLGRRRGLFIMLSAIISLADPKNLRLGEPPLESNTPMSDAKDVPAIQALPEHHWHVSQERAFLRLAAEKGQGVITAVVMSLPFTVGDGTGPVRTSGFVHAYAKALRNRPGRKPFVLGQGRNIWSWSSPRDVAAAIVRVVDCWIEDDGNSDLHGNIYVESGQLEMRGLARCVSQALSVISAERGEEPLASSNECDSLQYPQFAELMPELPGLWGVSARCQADKMRRNGWQPSDISWQPLVEECVRSSYV